jgi:hypothetical protein
MQDIVEPLTIIAEFSIGLAGFAGIIAAFDRKSIQLDPVIRFRFTMLIITAFSPGFLALIGMCAIYFGLSVSQALSTASSAAILVLGLMLLFGLFRKPDGLPKAMLAFMFSASFLNIGLHAYNVLAQPQMIVGFFLSALVLMLLQGATVFAVTVLARYK